MKTPPGVYQIKAWVNNTDVWDKLMQKINDFKGCTFVDGKFEILVRVIREIMCLFSVINKTVSQG